MIVRYRDDNHPWTSIDMTTFERIKFHENESGSFRMYFYNKKCPYKTIRPININVRFDPWFKIDDMTYIYNREFDRRIVISKLKDLEEQRNVKEHDQYIDEVLSKINGVEI